MPIDLWHHWLLLRLLLVLALAGLLPVFALLSRWRDRPRRSEGKAYDGDAPIARVAPSDGHPMRGSEPRVEASPAEWRVDVSASDRRAA